MLDPKRALGRATHNAPLHSVDLLCHVLFRWKTECQKKKQHVENEKTTPFLKLFRFLCVGEMYTT